jgi:hypothetical protein
MNQITEQVLSEKIAAQDAEINMLRGLLVPLLWKVGQGRMVTVPAGIVRQAVRSVESIDFRQLRSGEIRFTVKLVDKKEGKA